MVPMSRWFAGGSLSSIASDRVTLADWTGEDLVTRRFRRPGRFRAAQHERVRDPVGQGLETQRPHTRAERWEQREDVADGCPGIRR